MKNLLIDIANVKSDITIFFSHKIFSNSINTNSGECFVPTIFDNSQALSVVCSLCVELDNSKLDCGYFHSLIPVYSNDFEEVEPNY